MPLCSHENAFSLIPRNPPELKHTAMDKSCEERDGDRSDIDGRPEQFDSRLWSCVKWEPGARTLAVFVHCGVKPVSMNLTAV